MSKENAMRFMMENDKDEALHHEISAIMARIQEKNLSEDEWGGIWKEIVPLAKKYGYDFTLEDLKQLQKPAGSKLSDEELDEVTGGRGEIVLTFRNRYRSILTYKASCDYMPDNQTFQQYYDSYTTDCPHYVWFGNGNNIPSCSKCANCHLGML